MTAFNQCFLFLGNPNGGVEDFSYLKGEMSLEAENKEGKTV